MTWAHTCFGAGGGSGLLRRPLDPPQVRRWHEGIGHEAGCLDETSLALQEPSCPAQLYAMSGSCIAAGQLGFVRGAAGASMVAGRRVDLRLTRLPCGEIRRCGLRVSDPIGFGQGGGPRKGARPNHQHECRGG